jgi:hypothetical protein
LRVSSPKPAARSEQPGVPRSGRRSEL